jgi:hypothetical protein
VRLSCQIEATTATTKTKNQNKKMTAREKFQNIINRLNNLGLNEVEICERNSLGGRIETQAHLTVGQNYICATYCPSGYLHPRTSCKVFARIKGKPATLEHWIAYTRYSNLPA